MKKVHIIAEMAWGHDGSLTQAIDIMKTAKNSGADSISIHITNLEETMVKHYGSGKGKVSSGREEFDIYKYLEKINLSNEDWKKFKAETLNNDIKLVVMPNDLSSLNFAEEELNPDYYVVSAACFVEEDFLREVARKKRPTIFRIGGAYLGEIEKAVFIFREENNQDIILLHGFQNYPTDIKETNLAQLKILKEIFNCEVGLADHLDGGTSFAKVLPVLALPYGATYIEKHITLNRDDKSEDFESALNPSDFKEMVEYIRHAELAIGKSYIDQLSESAVNYRKVSRKKIVAKFDLKKGEVIYKDKLTFKRTDNGLEADKIFLVLNRILKQDISKDEEITLEKLL